MPTEVISHAYRLLPYIFDESDLFTRKDAI